MEKHFGPNILKCSEWCKIDSNHVSTDNKVNNNCELSEWIQMTLIFLTFLMFYNTWKGNKVSVSGSGRCPITSIEFLVHLFPRITMLPSTYQLS